jgi:hypothetical protein
VCCISHINQIFAIEKLTGTTFAASSLLTSLPSLETEAQIEDPVKYFTDLIQWAGWTATPETTCTPSSYEYPIFIKQKLAEKKKTPERMAPTTDTNKQKIIQQGYTRA